MISKIYYYVTEYWYNNTARRFRDTTVALGFSVIGILVLIGIFYSTYIAKSVMGIDIFPDKRLEDFVPLPGWKRW